MALNTNAIHNIINVVGWVTGAVSVIAISTGCVDVDQGAEVVLDCSKSFVPPVYMAPILGALFAIKQVINLTRDGFKGLWKIQPPVADAMTTVVTPVKAAVPGDKIVVTSEVKTTDVRRSR